jgi:RNA polymerase sigma-70 factor (ECF subfamily)
MKYTQEDLVGIFKDHQVKIYNLALRMSRNRQDAEDILQNTFLKVLKNIKKFRSESAISTWIYRIAINEANMKWRKQKSQEKLVKWGKEFFADQPFPMVDKEMVRKESGEAIDSAVRNLPLKYRAAVLLRDFQDMDYGQIARILGVSLASLKTRLHRSRQYLRVAMSKYNQEKAIPKFDPKISPPLSSNKCISAIKFLGDFIDGNIPEEKKIIFERHIADCRPCKVFLKDYQQAIRLTKSLQCEDIPSAFALRIADFLKLARKP